MNAAFSLFIIDIILELINKEMVFFGVLGFICVCCFAYLDYTEKRI